MGIGRIRYASHRHVHRRVVDTHVVFVAFELGKIDVLKIVILPILSVQGNSGSMGYLNLLTSSNCSSFAVELIWGCGTRP